MVLTRRAVVSHFVLPEGNVQISFSGGRTSAYMLHEIMEANGGLPERVQVVFSNTGREMPETLDFVAEVDARWNVGITWVQYLPAAPHFEVVGRQGAAVDGAPFEALIRRRTLLPNQQARFCTQELKIRPAKRYLMSIGWRRWTSALGIRADEPGRVRREPQKERWQRWYPLADAGVTKREVQAFWSRQPFDLRLQNINGKTPWGNCDGCFLKSEKTLAALSRDMPERHQWWEDMEALATSLSRAKGMEPGRGARWSKRYTRRQLRERMEAHGDFLMNFDGALCQSDDGDCIE